MTGLICPKCGANSDEKAFIEAFCVDCYPISIRCPKKLEIEQCRQCKKIRLKGEWTGYSRQKISEYVIEKCKGDYTQGSYDIEKQEAEFTVMKEGNQAKITIGVPTEIKPSMCRHCSQISGGYFEGIIQLRGDRKKVEKMAGMFIKNISKRSFITKEKEKDNGLDLYVGSSKAVIDILSEMGIKALITRKLVGRQEGRRLYRTTFLVRV